MVKGFATASPFTPAVDVNYIFHEHSRDLVVWFLGPNEPLYVFGPCGCGKTSCIKQLAAKLNYPVFEVTGHSRLEFPELIGHHVVRNGNMEFEYGPLALAMRYGGLFLCNEIDLLEPSTAAGLNGILDGQPLCVPENGGELIAPHPLFRFAATANTNGGSDETGLYQGALRQNTAFMDRFRLCEVGYPKPEAEEQLLAKTVGQLPEPLRKKMVEYAGEVRRLFMGEKEDINGGIEITFSTRTLLRWADLTVRYQPLSRQGIQPVSHALDRALGFRACKATRAMLHELVQRVFPRNAGE
jgi:cobaltochelatase CobS